MTMVNSHLVILKKPYLNAILEGRKRIESRFYKAKGHGFGCVFAGDKLFLKISSGPVCATATVEAVKYFQNLTPEKILELKNQYNCDIDGDDDVWREKMDCTCGFLVWLKDVKTIEPVLINKKDWRAWVVLTDKKNFGMPGLCGAE
jgi:ASC-1-like (ASCH) protein